MRCGATASRMKFQFFRKLVICLVLINIMSLILLKRSQLKPPLVIRVDDVGKAEPIQNINTLAQLTKPEVLNFTKLFMKYFLERNFYTWKREPNRRWGDDDAGISGEGQ